MKQCKCGLGWVSAEMKPQYHEAVAVFVNGERYKYWARAMWVPKFTREDNGGYEGESDYNDKDDNYYWPEGWYEWNHADEVHWIFSDVITHWAKMVLPNAEVSGE